MVKLLDRVKQSVSGTASSTTLGAAATGFRTFNTAGAATNDVCRYAIEDDNGAFEIGTIVINSATTGTRTVQISSNSNNALTLTGNAVIFATLSAADLSGNAAPIWNTTPPAQLGLANDGSTAVTLAGVAIDEFPIQYSWDGYSGTSVYNDMNLPPQLASAPTFSGGTVSMIGSSSSSNAGTFNFRMKASDGVKTATSITAVSLAFSADLSNASYDNISLSVASQDIYPRDLAFSSTGDKMYVVGNSSDSVYEYDLSTNWDVSSASFNSVSLSVSSQDSSPRGLAFSSTGDKMYVVGYSRGVYEYDLSTNWDLSTAQYNNVSFSVASQDSAPNGVVFKQDGSKMYIAGSSSDSVYEYDLSTNWDVSTAQYNNVSFSVASQDTGPTGLAFFTDGSVMYVVGSSSDSVYQYDLSTNWDLSTAQYNNVSFSVASQDTIPSGVVFKQGGSKMYILGDSGNSVYQYST